MYPQRWVEYQVQHLEYCLRTMTKGDESKEGQEDGGKDGGLMDGWVGR